MTDKYDSNLADPKEYCYSSYSIRPFNFLESEIKSIKTKHADEDYYIRFSKRGYLKSKTYIENNDNKLLNVFHEIHVLKFVSNDDYKEPISSTMDDKHMWGTFVVIIKILDAKYYILVQSMLDLAYVLDHLGPFWQAKEPKLK